MMTNNQSSSIFLKSKEEAMPHILTWLGRTYVEKPGSMLLKKDVHAAYSAFCAEHRFETTTNAAFGKMFKRVFPRAEVRRLVKHNETTFFYENMTAQSPSGNAPPPLSASPSPDLGNGNGSPRPASESTPAQEGRPRLEGSTHSPKRRRATAKEKGGLGRSVKREEEEEEEGTEAELTRDDQKGFGREERTAVRPEWASAEVSAPVGQPQLTSWTSDAQLGFTDTLHRFCQLYRHEMWGFCPINPSMVEYPTLSYIFNTDHGTAERSALSVAAHYVVSMGYLLLGDVTHGREFFWKAREHLSYVFDSSNYDVACLLKHMSWAAMLFSGTGSEGHERETYYLSLCKNMCQMLGAENDGLYLGTLKMMAIIDRTTSYEGEMQKALRSPHYANGWLGTGPMATHAHFNEHFTARLLESYKNIVLLTEASRQGPQRPPSQIYQDFIKELLELQRYEDGFIQIYGESPPPRLCGIHISCLLVCRAIVHNHLNNHGAVEQHLRGLVQHFSRIDAASVAIVITEFGSRGIFWREVVSVMLQHQLYDQLGQLAQITHPLRQHFYWIDAEMSHLDKAMGEAYSVRVYPTALPSKPPPRDHSPRSPSPLFPYPYVAVGPSQLPDFREPLDPAQAEARHGTE